LAAEKRFSAAGRLVAYITRVEVSEAKGTISKKERERERDGGKSGQLAMENGDGYCQAWTEMGGIGKNGVAATLRRSASAHWATIRHPTRFHDMYPPFSRGRKTRERERERERETSCHRLLTSGTYCTSSWTHLVAASIIEARYIANPSTTTHFTVFIYLLQVFLGLAIARVLYYKLRILTFAAHTEYNRSICRVAPLHVNTSEQSQSHPCSLL